MTKDNWASVLQCAAQFLLLKHLIHLRQINLNWSTPHLKVYAWPVSISEKQSIKMYFHVCYLLPQIKFKQAPTPEVSSSLKYDQEGPKHCVSFETVLKLMCKGIAQASLEVTLQLKMTMISWIFGVCFPNVGITYVVTTCGQNPS